MWLSYCDYRTVSTILWLSYCDYHIVTTILWLSYCDWYYETITLRWRIRLFNGVYNLVVIRENSHILFRHILLNKQTFKFEKRKNLLTQQKLHEKYKNKVRWKISANTKWNPEDSFSSTLQNRFSVSDAVELSITSALEMLRRLYTKFYWILWESSRSLYLDDLYSASVAPESMRRISHRWWDLQCSANRSSPVAVTEFIY